MCGGISDEHETLARLLADGWLVAAGERFRIASTPAVRVTTAALEPAEAPQFAATLAAALQCVPTAGPTGPDCRVKPSRKWSIVRRPWCARDAPKFPPRGPPPPVVRPLCGDVAAGRVPRRSVHPTPRTVRPPRGRSRRTGAAPGSPRRCVWPSSPAA